MKDTEFLKKLSSLSQERKEEVIRLVDFAFEERRAIKKQYGLTESPPKRTA
jgi:hypothetical protein